MPTSWSRSRVRQVIVGLVALKVFGLIVIFDWTQSLLHPFDLTKSVFSRGVEWVLVALLAIAVARYGWRVLPATRLHAAVLAVVLASLASALFAEDRFVAVFGTAGRYLGLTFIVDMAVLYAAVAASFRTDRDWAALAAAVFGGLLLTCAYGFVQYLGGDPIPWKVSFEGRPFSSMANPDAFGHLLGVIFATGLAVLVFLWRSRKSIAIIGGLAGALAIAMLSVVAARGALVGAVVAIAAMAALSVSSARLRARRVARYGLAFVGILLLGAVGVWLTPLGSRSLIAVSDPSTQGRLIVYQVAVRAFLDRPVLGFGPDNFGALWPRYRPGEFAAGVNIAAFGPDWFADSAHSWLVQAGATLGAVGVIALVGLFSLTALQLVRSGARSPISRIALVAFAAYLANALVSIGSVGVDWIPWVSAGTAAAMLSRSDPTAARQLPRVTVALPLGAATLAAVIGLNTLQADADTWRARTLADSGQGVDAEASAARAVTKDPGRVDSWNELGRARYEEADWKGSAQAFAEASARAPWSPTFWLNQARAQTQQALHESDRSAYAAAAQLAGRAVEADPNNPSVNSGAADVFLAVGVPERSLEAAAKAIQLYPFDQRYDNQARTAAHETRDLPGAITVLQRALESKNSVQLRLALADVALRAGNGDLARQNAQRALDLDPANVEALALLKAVGG